MYQIQEIVFNAIRYGWTRVSVKINTTNTDDMIAWVQNMATNFWYTTMDPKTLVNLGTTRRFYFLNESDALAFILRWTL